ncbi:monooxygenase [Salinisphaera japonica]
MSTAAFADSIGAKAGSIRVRLCQTGSYFGIKPKKLPNGRLLWPADSVERLLGEVPA